MGEFPSGQRGQTVNLLSVTSVVRIHLPPPKIPNIRQDGRNFLILGEGGFERRLLATCRWHVATAVGSEPSAASGRYSEVNEWQRSIFQAGNSAEKLGTATGNFPQKKRIHLPVGFCWRVRKMGLTHTVTHTAKCPKSGGEDDRVILSTSLFVFT